MQPSTLPEIVKPRRRRRWPWVVGFVLLLFATPVIVSMVAGWLAERQMQALYAEIEADDPGWRWKTLVAKLQPIPGEPNSAEQALKVRALLAKSALFLPPKWDNEANQKLLTYRNARLNAEQLQMLSGALGALDREAIPEARKLKDFPEGRFAFAADDNPFTMAMPYIQQTRDVMRLLDLDAMMRSEHRDFDGALESCQALVNTSRALRVSPTLIAQLVRYAGHAISVESIERALGQGEPSDVALKRLQERLEAELADDGLANAMRGERASGQQVYEQIRTGKITVSQIMGVTGTNVGPGEWLVNMFPGIVLGSYPEYLHVMHEQVKIAKLKDVERSDAFAKVDAELRSGNTGWLVRLMVPAVTKVHEATLRSQAYLRCTTVAVAAERYRLKHERWPASMKELVNEGLIKTEYADPYDGQALRMRRTKTGLVVYSVGKDKIDNGGAFNRENPVAAGTDMGFELWDPPLRRVMPPQLLEK